MSQKGFDMLLKKRNLKFEMYDDSKGEYRWRLKAGNGAIIGDSGEGYVSENYCKAAIGMIKSEVANAEVVDCTSKRAASAAIASLLARGVPRR